MLAGLLEREYKFETQIVELTNGSAYSPQMQLEKQILSLLFNRDGPPDRQLLVVYYTGNIFTSDSGLVLAG